MFVRSLQQKGAATDSVVQNVRSFFATRRLLSAVTSSARMNEKPVLQPVLADPFLTLFLSFLTYLVVILGGVYIVWLFPVIKNGPMRPSSDCFIRWSTDAASFLHAVVMSSVGLLVVFFEDWTTKSLFEGHSPLIPTFIAWEVGHQLQQAMFKCYLMMENSRSNELMPLISHAVLISCLPWYDRFSIADFFLGLFFLAYLSSAFRSFRTLLSKAGKERTSLYQFVSSTYPFSFVFCRFLPLLVIFIKDVNKLQLRTLNEIPIKYLILISSVTVYNAVSFIQMLRLQLIHQKLKIS